MPASQLAGAKQTVGSAPYARAGQKRGATPETQDQSQRPAAKNVQQVAKPTIGSEKVATDGDDTKQRTELDPQVREALALCARLVLKQDKSQGSSKHVCRATAVEKVLAIMPLCYMPIPARSAVPKHIGALISNAVFGQPHDTKVVTTTKRPRSGASLRHAQYQHLME